MDVFFLMMIPDSQDLFEVDTKTKKKIYGYKTSGMLAAEFCRAKLKKGVFDNEIPFLSRSRKAIQDVEPPYLFLL